MRKFRFIRQLELMFRILRGKAVIYNTAFYGGFTMCPNQDVTINDCYFYNEHIMPISNEGEPTIRLWRILWD